MLLRLLLVAASFLLFMFGSFCLPILSLPVASLPGGRDLAGPSQAVSHRPTTHDETHVTAVSVFSFVPLILRNSPGQGAAGGRRQDSEQGLRVSLQGARGAGLGRCRFHIRRYTGKERGNGTID